MNESTRLVYVEGVTLKNAQNLSKIYRNVVFITNDNEESSKDTIRDKYSESRGAYVNNEEWPLGINLVRNGVTYIPISGIHPTMNSFNVDEMTYTLKVQKDTGLLCLVSERIEERLIYIGLHPQFLEYFIDDLLGGNLDSLENRDNIDDPGIATEVDDIIIGSYDLSNTTSGGTAKDVMLYILHESDDSNDNDADNYDTYSYLIVYKSLSKLGNSHIGPLTFLNMAINSDLYDQVIYTYDKNTGTFTCTTQSYLNPEHGDFSTYEALWAGQVNADNPIHIILYEGHSNNINVINTLTRNEHALLDNDTVSIQNIPAFSEGEIEKVYKTQQKLGSVDYNDYTISEIDEIKGISIEVVNT